jgi:hypothetical protein
MLDPIDSAYAAPKSQSAEALGRDEREQLVAIRLAGGFLLATEVFEVGRWLIRVLPLMLVTATPDDLGVVAAWFFPRIANGVSAVFLLRGRRRIVWLPIALGAWREFRRVLSGALEVTSPFQTTVALAIFLLYAGILLVLASKRPGRTHITAAVVGIAAYLVLIVVEWFNPIIIELPFPAPYPER